MKYIELFLQFVLVDNSMEVKRNRMTIVIPL